MEPRLQRGRSRGRWATEGTIGEAALKECSDVGRTWDECGRHGEEEEGAKGREAGRAKRCGEWMEGVGRRGKSLLGEKQGERSDGESG